MQGLNGYIEYKSGKNVSKNSCPRDRVKISERKSKHEAERERT